MHRKSLIYCERCLKEPSEHPKDLLCEACGGQLRQTFVDTVFDSEEEAKKRRQGRVMNGKRSRIYFGTCEKCGLGFCYEDERIDEAYNFLDRYKNNKRLTDKECAEIDLARESIQQYQKEHSICTLCERKR